MQEPKPLFFHLVPTVMTELYWICLLGGLVLSVVAVLVGDAIEGLLEGLDSIDLDGMLDPLAIVAGITAFGGAGILLDAYTGLGHVPAALLAAVAGFALAVLMQFAYIKPIKRSENSTGFSMREYQGKIGEVNTAIPAQGYGEVLVQMGASTTFQAAASFDHTPIATGTKVVVVEVAAEGVLLVTPFEEELPSLPGAQRPALGAGTSS